MGFASIPMIFELQTALWFNEHYVTTDVPEDRDLETPLESGDFKTECQKDIKYILDKYSFSDFDNFK